jgi:hypothetical protein
MYTVLIALDDDIINQQFNKRERISQSNQAGLSFGFRIHIAFLLILLTIKIRDS